MLQRSSERNRKGLSLLVLGWDCWRLPVPPGNSLRNSGQQGRAVAGGKCVNQEKFLKIRGGWLFFRSKQLQSLGGLSRTLVLAHAHHRSILAHGNHKERRTERLPPVLPSVPLSELWSLARLVTCLPNHRGAQKA